MTCIVLRTWTWPRIHWMQLETIYFSKIGWEEQRCRGYWHPHDHILEHTDTDQINQIWSLNRIQTENRSNRIRKSVSKFQNNQKDNDNDIICRWKWKQTLAQLCINDQTTNNVKKLKLTLLSASVEMLIVGQCESMIHWGFRVQFNGSVRVITITNHVHFLIPIFSFKMKKNNDSL